MVLRAPVMIWPSRLLAYWRIAANASLISNTVPPIVIATPMIPAKPARTSAPWGVKLSMAARVNSPGGQENSTKYQCAAAAHRDRIDVAQFHFLTRWPTCRVRRPKRAGTNSLLKCYVNSGYSISPQRLSLPSGIPSEIRSSRAGVVKGQIARRYDL